MSYSLKVPFAKYYYELFAKARLNSTTKCRTNISTENHRLDRVYCLLSVQCFGYAHSCRSPFFVSTPKISSRDLLWLFPSLSTSVVILNKLKLGCFCCDSKYFAQNRYISLKVTRRENDQSNILQYLSLKKTLAETSFLFPFFLLSFFFIFSQTIMMSVD